MDMATGSRNEMRIILLGKTGTGKSAFGNTIVGARRFLSGISPLGVTEHCACASRDFGGKQLFVVDTPGFLDPRIEKTEIQIEVAKAYQLTALPGPHVFLLVVEPRRFTSEEAEAVNTLDSVFGPRAIKHTIIIFTHSDSFDPIEGTLESYLAKLPSKSALRIILDQCEDRYLAVNNKGTEAEKRQVIETLINMVASMIAKNGNQIYRTAQFDDTAKVLAEEKAKGVYNQFNPDGSIALLPKVKEIIVEGFLRRTIGKKVVH